MISFIIVSIIIFSFSALISYYWVGGIDFMMENHPDYKGDDLFGPFDEDDKHQIM
jgi:hypothetical protein